MLSKVLTVATAMAHATLPHADVKAACAWMDDLEREVPALQRAYQYPHRIGDRPIVNCHQIALRKPASQGVVSVAGAEEACLHAVTDLHVDSQDGGGGWTLGAATLYWCVPRPGETLPPSVSEAALRSRDLAVFAPTRHPRGVRTCVMRPGWLCMLITKTRSCPHGGICPMDISPIPSLLLPELMCGKAVTYTLTAVEKLLADCAASPKDCAHIQHSERDERLSRRMLGEYVRQSE